MINQYKTNIKVLYWNANSLFKKIIELYLFMTVHKVDVACVSETFLKQNDILHSHPEFVVESLCRSDTGDRRSGGVAIIIRRSLHYELLRAPHTKLIEAIGIKIKINGNRTMNLYSVYLPGGTSNRDINTHYVSDIKTLIRQARSNYAICGDLNSKHRFWNCSRANRAGKLLYDAYCSNDFMIFHPDTPTHYPTTASYRPSTIDLTLSDGRYRMSNFDCHSSDSDHNIVTFDIKLNEPINERDRGKVPCYKLTDWQKYQQTICNKLEPLSSSTLNDISTTDQIDQLIDKLTGAIKAGQIEAVPMVRPNRYELILPKYIEDMICTRNNTIRRLQRNPNLHHILRPHINWLTSKIRENIQLLRNVNWNHKLESLPYDDNYRSLFKTAKFLKNRDRTIPPLKDHDTLLITAQEKADTLADQFEKNHTNPLEEDNTTHTKHVEAKVKRFKQNCPVNQNLRQRQKPKYTTVIELINITKKMKNSKAPGMDKIHNSLVKKLPRIGFFVLALIINSCFKLNYFPVQWKHAKIIAIKKPNKPPSSPASYRPISLLSSLSKIMERVVLTRLQSHLQNKNAIPSQQHGFQSGKSTTTLLTGVVQKIKDTLHGGLSTGMLLLDIEKAFDRVWHSGLVYKLICLNTPHHLTLLIASFLQGRTFHVDINGQRSRTVSIKYGVPQGAVLSPTLYNIYTADLPNNVNSSVAMFADDTAFMSTSRYFKSIEKDLILAFNKAKNYFTRWKVTLNASKTQCIFFTRRRTKQIPTGPICLSNTNVNWDHTVKYLGVMLDKGLTFKNHVEYVSTKAHKAVRILYSMLSRNSKLNLRNKTLLYVLGIRPIMTYASPVINQIAATHIKHLQIAQNKCLRMITCAEPGTSNIDIHDETNLETIREFIHRLSVNFEAEHPVSN